MSLDKAAIERELRESWGDIRTLVESLPAGESEEPGVVEEWSVKDLLGHMAFWAEKAAADLKLVAEDRIGDIETPGTEENLNAWNARESERRRSLALGDVREEWARSFEAAETALNATPVEHLDIEVKGWTMARRFAEDTYNHYKEHAEQIRAWQRQLETTEA